MVAAVGASFWSSAAGAVTQAAGLDAVQPAKTSKNVEKAASPQPTPYTKSSDGAVNSHLPLGLLLSISPPSTSNAQASSDYVDLQNALRIGNLAAAQQAYIRLEGDLLSSQAGAGAADTAGRALNVVA